MSTIAAASSEWLSHVYGLRVIPQLLAIRANHRRHADFPGVISQNPVSLDCGPGAVLTQRRDIRNQWEFLDLAK